ncbi:MarR family winged helix-turn-helix transcriptional regulator [Priestia megaterium]|jgi:DNA-binding MarR family transcriptional regulator|uniref:MarR family winged helix-turn-helix transcriptional regulator n=1 Tax=Priestia megaterium TaxID=1404 RepID=UPI00077D9428|nr:MarR family winged helix-turn-helix transcriptional regulator [Priestia megaterium]MBG9474472.1 MarR family transcriptional regulator [Priestia megaterium]MDH3180195.1 MarR family winged helix-turn-helix transcriptional regulator [Priestia megaterium]PFP19856.1 MarR family transcriptional regulator [Priestia megaterium]PFU61183.1 MarR family transcriptional regulator [Priestia megaterium]QDZ86328.1 MarR family transcriptional regulator [Priestia megaterium]
MDLHDLTSHLIHRTDVRAMNYFKKKLKPYGMTPVRWSIISVLDSQKGRTQTELAEAIDKKQTTIVEMIYAMEEKGFIKRMYSERDRRLHYLFLTEKGEELKKTLSPLVKDAHLFVTRQLSDEENTQLKTLLNKVYNGIQ